MWQRYARGVAEFGCAARLAAIPAGESPANRRSPVTVVVISSNGEGDRSVESLEVKVPEGWTFQSDPYRGASNLAGRSGSEPVKPRNLPPARNGLRECRECRAGGQTAKAMSASKFWNITMSDSPGSERAACQEGMCSESSEPLAGRLGAPAQRRHHV
jgi:hypothetical protein